MEAIYPFLINVYKKNIANIDEIFIALILITLPLGGYAINSIVVILFFLLSIYRFVKTKQSLKFSKISILFIAFYFLGVLSLLWTDSIKNTLEGLSRFLSFLILPIAFTLNSEKKFGIDSILDKFSKSMVIYAFYCILSGIIKSIIHNDINFMFYHELSGNLSGLNAIYLSVFISLAIGFLLIHSIKSKINLFYLIFLGIFLMLLSSKIIISITFIYTVFYLIKTNFSKKIKPKYFIVVISALVIFMISSVNFVNRFRVEYEKTKINEVLGTNDFGPVYLWTGVGLRVFQTKAFLEIVSEKKQLFLGSGLNNSQENLNNKYKQYNLYPGFLNYNFHNQYLQVFAELGIVGFSLLLLILYSLFHKAIVQKDYFVLFFIITVLTVSITESFLWRQRGMIFFITLTLLINQKQAKLSS
ncbi:MAG: O-antigen ligase family protein [Flavobacteriia bacterium]|nr:O-antigen ligase family protein [Flavobacteriia bacterium]OIP46333.1 MAG: hypothetical protein AUK46_08940 [Flavobacteriaceae bacterium CG2_30_31_66]PIV95700.1 MAG: hypothetical protein COW43_12135 [Flavobacteriaceae bacterium CG17_big_fil_post_rev_8_21_14_2_50_31_13]PIX12155.1 MAG: hypothetical protein COZ74_12170 [Flavobacteriaceae bacterium CG_4_8_14_3_um_filter_31_8]PIY15598.1 MAG: hypothetical protein COZ16_03560 [Flavobacteriaceae bacterium CG_4_10_14_3_um_filter_31_253]PIZ09269.1 MAG